LRQSLAEHQYIEAMPTGRLQAMLKERLPKVAVSVSVEYRLKNAEEVAAMLVAGS
jgi:hypothetical protein